MTDQPRAGRQLHGKDVDAAGQGQQGIRSVREGDPANAPATNTDKPKKEYRLKSDSPSTWMNGVLKHAGDPVELTDDQARAASQYVETTDGKAIPSERQILPGDEGSTVERANLSGLARHERIDALQQEEKRLSARLDQVRAQLANEEKAAADTGAQQQQRQEPNPPAAPEGGGSVEGTSR